MHHAQKQKTKSFVCFPSPECLAKTKARGVTIAAPTFTRSSNLQTKPNASMSFQCNEPKHLRQTRNRHTVVGVVFVHVVQYTSQWQEDADSTCHPDKQYM